MLIIYLNACFLLLNFSKNLFELTPGSLFSALTQIPESSAKQGILKILKPYKDFIFAFSAKNFPVSFGSETFGKSFKLKINHSDL